MDPIPFGRYVDHMEEERRLAFVGFTRARMRLVLSYAEAAEDTAPGGYAGGYAGGSAGGYAGGYKAGGTMGGGAFASSSSGTSTPRVKPSRFLSAVE